MKIALLGGDGFVGSNIKECLEEKKINFDIASLKSGVDLRDENQAISFFKESKPDFIINCAAHVGSLNYVTEQAATIISDNSRMIISMYEAIRRSCPRAIVINPIANCAYPAKSETFSEDMFWDGQVHHSVLSYGTTKRMLLVTAECFNMQHKIQSINLISPNMYGPHDSTDPNKAHALNALISKFIKAQKTQSKSVEIWGTGIAIREWLYAKDFGKIIIRIIEKPDLTGLAEPTNIAQNFGLSVKTLVNLIQKHLQFDGIIKYDELRPEGALKKVMDDTKFKKVFPDFEFTALDDGIKNTIKYYESIYPY
ncbi:MAG: NAD-dependent epimerase/dehydratase family protein [Parcubacteria group bacterium]